MSLFIKRSDRFDMWIRRNAELTDCEGEILEMVRIVLRFQGLINFGLSANPFNYS